MDSVIFETWNFMVTKSFHCIYQCTIDMGNLWNKSVCIFFLILEVYLFIFIVLGHMVLRFSFYYIFPLNIARVLIFKVYLSFFFGQFQIRWYEGSVEKKNVQKAEN